jgi:uncharacterized Zn finger protein
LQRVADEPSYSRGIRYFEDGRVTDIRVKDECIRADVRGTHHYHVRLWAENGELAYSCTCPFHQDEAVCCKHCIAAALAFLDAEGGSRQGQTRSREERGMSMGDVEEYLESQDKASLISLVMDQADEDERLKSRLLMKAGTRKKTVSLAGFRKLIDRAVDWGDYVDYKSMHEYAQGLDDVVSSLRELLDEGHAAEVVELTEYFLQCVEVQMDMMDDSDGTMGGVLEEVQDIHHSACMAVKPDAEHLARKLFNLEVRDDSQAFYHTVEKYQDVLGEKGLSVYRRLAEKKWAHMRPLGPGEEDLGYSRERFRITSIMERLAEQAGDIEQLVAVKSNDLSTAFAYLEIAELYQKAGKLDKALDWAEKGVRAFPRETDFRLREFLADEYHKQKRHDEAMQLIWAEFADSPRFEEYKLLRKHAERASGGGKRFSF